MEQILTILRGQGHGMWERIFIPTWFGLMVVSFAVWKASSPATRQRLLPVGAVVSGAIFLFFFYWMTRGTRDGSSPFFFVVIAMVLFIVYSNARLTRVCQGCGAGHGPRKFLTPAAFCRKCGSRLDA
jgi:hypothetical protein